MLSSRGVQLVKYSKFLSINHKICYTNARNSGHAPWNYRSPPPRQPEKVFKFAEFASAVSWWWIFWHLWTEPGHVFGEFEYPNPALWSDEELGVPSRRTCG